MILDVCLYELIQSMKKDRSSKFIRIFLNISDDKKLKQAAHLTGFRRTKIIKLAIDDVISNTKTNLPLNQYNLLSDFPEVSVTTIYHLNVRVTPQQKDKLQEASKATKVDVSELIVRAVRRMYADLEIYLQAQVQKIR